MLSIEILPLDPDSKKPDDCIWDIEAEFKLSGYEDFIAKPESVYAVSKINKSEVIMDKFIESPVLGTILPT